VEVSGGYFFKLILAELPPTTMNTLDHDLLLGIVVFIDNTRISTFRAVSVQFKTIATDRFIALQTRELNATRTIMNKCKLNGHAVLLTLAHLAYHNMLDDHLTYDTPQSLINDAHAALTNINRIIELCMTNVKAYDTNNKPIFAQEYSKIGHLAYDAYWSFSIETIRTNMDYIVELSEPVKDDDDMVFQGDYGNPIFAEKYQEIGSLAWNTCCTSCIAD